MPVWPIRTAIVGEHLYTSTSIRTRARTTAGVVTVKESGSFDGKVRVPALLSSKLNLQATLAVNYRYVLASAHHRNCIRMHLRVESARCISDCSLRRHVKRLAVSC